MKKIVIIGNGNLGNILAKKLNVSSIFSARHLVDFEEQINHADCVLLTCPGFLIENVLRKIAPFLKSTTLLGSIVGSNGFVFFARLILPHHQALFAFARVPYIARDHQILSCRALHYLAFNQVENPQKLKAFWERVLQKPVVLLPKIENVALSNSNPLLHTARLFGLFGQKHAYENPIYFYKEWDDFSSHKLLQMDEELQQLLKKLHVSSDALPPLTQHYDVHNAFELSQKIRSIAAFENILAPMIQSNKIWVAHFAHRYFQEDVHLTFLLLVHLLELYEIKAPVCFEVANWAKTLPLGGAIFSQNHIQKIAQALFTPPPEKINLFLFFYKNPRSTLKNFQF